MSLEILSGFEILRGSLDSDSLLVICFFPSSSSSFFSSLLSESSFSDFSVSEAGDVFCSSSSSVELAGF